MSPLELFTIIFRTVATPPPPPSPSLVVLSQLHGVIRHLIRYEYILVLFMLRQLLLISYAFKRQHACLYIVFFTLHETIR